MYTFKIIMFFAMMILPLIFALLFFIAGFLPNLTYTNEIDNTTRKVGLFGRIFIILFFGSGIYMIFHLLGLLIQHG